MSAKNEVAVALRPLDIRTDLHRIVMIGQSVLDYPFTDEEYLQRLRKWRCPAVGAVVDGKLIAWLITEREKELTTLWAMAVANGHDRRKIGSRLLQWLKTDCAEAGSTLIRTSVRETNLAAQLFLKSGGLQAVKVLRKHFPQKEDGYVMDNGVRGCSRTRP
jgi:ribosomal protein S18 acetylase RimI-like enzyme